MKPTYTREQLEALRDNGHTEGPWEVYPGYNPGIEATEESIVCFGDKGEECGVQGTHKNQQENADLIAAAPALLIDLLSALDEIERLQKEIKALKKDPEQSCDNCTGNGLQSVWPSQCTSCTPGGDDSLLRNWKLKETTNER